MQSTQAAATNGAVGVSSHQVDIQIEDQLNEEFSNREPSGRRLDLSLQIPPKPLGFGSSRNGKVLQSQGSYKGSSPSPGGFFRGLSFNKKSAVSAEIMAIVRACHLCASSPNLKDKRIVFVSDSKEVVSWINSNGVGSWQHMNQIMDIRNLLGVLNQSHVEFNLRDNNTYADGLAKKGADGG